MSEEEYIKKKKDLEIELRLNILNLNAEYAHANNHLKRGDIAEDHIGKIRVESISYGYVSYGLPQCIYKGQTLKKDGTETAKKEQREVYQSNLKS